MAPSPGAWRIQGPSALPFLSDKTSHTFVYVLVFSTFTHTELTGLDILGSYRTRKPASSHAFRPGGMVYVQEPRDLVLGSTRPLTTVYTSASFPVLEFCRESSKINGSPECFITRITLSFFISLALSSCSVKSCKLTK